MPVALDELLMIGISAGITVRLNAWKPVPPALVVLTMNL